MSQREPVVGLNEDQSYAFHELVIERRTFKDVAKELNVSTRTLFRWQTLPEWRSAEMVVDAAVQADHRRQLGALASTSIGTLSEILKDAQAPAASRVSAAIGVLDRTGFGPRSSVSVEHSGSIATDPVGDLDAINGALSALDAPDTSPV